MESHRYAPLQKAAREETRRTTEMLLDSGASPDFGPAYNSRSCHKNRHNEATKLCCFIRRKLQIITNYLAKGLLGTTRDEPIEEDL
jgi:hypothetical protein